MKKIFKVLGLLILLCLIIFTIWAFVNMKDRHPGYKADLKIINENASPLKAGFGKMSISPEIIDTWVDANGDAEYNPKDGDYFEDKNGNGKFDAIWIAGFSNAKPANGVHDDLWARTMILDDGQTRVAIVILDAIGFMQDDVIDIRKMLPAELGITYTIIASTHDHEAPDLMGLWGKTPFRSGVNQNYMAYVKQQAVKSIETAVQSLRPARIEISEDPEGAAHLVRDTREPQAFDSGLRFMKIMDKETDTVMGSLLSWANHAETLWSKNLMVSSDFPHYFRKGVEDGVWNDDSLVMSGIGGTAVYMNGAIGGLMTTHSSQAVCDPFTGEEITEPSFQKIKAQGDQLSLLALKAMQEPAQSFDNAGISLIVRTIKIPIHNNIFKLATALGVLNRGTSGWMKLRTELAVLKIGPVSIVAIPGEIYPEIINGGIENPDGADFKMNPVEIPPIREMMPGKYKFIIGLANDEIGYIIPKSQWDKKAPFAYGKDKAQYGEVNSVGPETAPILHRNIKEMLKELGD